MKNILFNPIYKNIISTAISIKKDILHYFFQTKYLKSSVHFILTADLNLN